MELKDIAAISGKSGLFKVLKPSKTGVILESLDQKKLKMVAGVHHKVSLLDEISIYTNTSEGSAPLLNVLQKIFSEFEDDPGVDPTSSPDELRAFLKYILPDYDENKVYASDIKKVISWYNILLKEAPEILKEKQEETAEKEKDEKDEKKEKKNNKKKNE